MDRKSVKKFVVGREPFPSWFKEKLGTGRAKIHKDEDGELEKITIMSATKTYVAKPGDIIVLNSKGMTVQEAEEKEEKKDVKEQRV